MTLGHGYVRLHTPHSAMQFKYNENVDMVCQFRRRCHAMHFCTTLHNSMPMISMPDSKRCLGESSCITCLVVCAVALPCRDEY